MGLELYKPTEAEILKRKKEGVIYVADFPGNSGKYISVSEYDDYSGQDLDLKISSKITLRITYIAEKNKISGVEISKLFNGNLEKINFSTMGFERILQLLHIFSELDLKSITNKKLKLEKTILDNPVELDRLLDLVVKDPVGAGKLSEIVKNYSLIKKGDIDDLIDRKKAVDLFNSILNNESDFNIYKEELGVVKNEEVWQRFFQINDWILGAEYVEILDHRNIDEESITDYLLKSYDGFVDIIELKLHTAEVWTKDNNPTADLTKATMQCVRYISEIEKKIDSKKFNDKLGDSSVVKPKITLIYGRSNNWNLDEKESYRILNSSYHNISILTFDHVLERAKRITETSGTKETQVNKDFSEDVNLEDIPF